MGAPHLLQWLWMFNSTPPLPGRLHLAWKTATSLLVQPCEIRLWRWSRWPAGDHGGVGQVATPQHPTSQTDGKVPWHWGTIPAGWPCHFAMACHDGFEKCCTKKVPIPCCAKGSSLASEREMIRTGPILLQLLSDINIRCQLDPSHFFLWRYPIFVVPWWGENMV